MPKVLFLWFKRRTNPEDKDGRAFKMIRGKERGEAMSLELVMENLKQLFRARAQAVDRNRKVFYLVSIARRKIYKHIGPFIVLKLIGMYRLNVSSFSWPSIS